MPRPATITLRVSPVTSRLRRPGRRTAAVLAAAALGATVLAACSTQSQAQTNVPYQPADGINLNLGAIDARGLLVVSAAKDAAGVMVGSLINSGPDPVTVTFLTVEQAQSNATDGPSMDVKAYSQTPISGVQLASVPAAPGDLTTVVLQSSKAGQLFANVPVLLPDGYYSTLTATAPPTTATTTATTASAATATVTTTVTGSATTTAPTTTTTTTTGG
ncbi:MAG TPA: hypothetical protein VNC23_07610 [Lapillicoccus sp.]|nr:hypothetical protein [Lapillicoccus sp.]